MRYLFYAFCAACVLLWLIGWAVLIAEELSQKKQQQFSNWLKEMCKKYGQEFIALTAAITLSGCASTGNVQIKHTCPPMLREATYQAMQADELADYRIAVEQCK